MAGHDWLRTAVHVHIVAAGYLFTAAMVGVDPDPRRPARPVRAIILIAFLAAHGILAKFLYGHPPAGVPAADAQAGAELMYYGGDLVDLALIAVFCRQWYDATGPARRGPRVPASRPVRPLWRLPKDIGADGEALPRSG